MPHSQTILRAISVACSMSFWAPVVICEKVVSSAMRPPMQTAIRASSCSFDQLCFSSLGSCWVRPSAMPRGMIVTLCSGSECGTSAATRACPASW